MGIYEKAREILTEIDRILARVNEDEVARLREAVQSAQHILHGLGCEGLVMRAFAMRLMNLGLKVTVVGDVTAPPIGPGDLFLVPLWPWPLGNCSDTRGNCASCGWSSGSADRPAGGTSSKGS